MTTHRFRYIIFLPIELAATLAGLLIAGLWGAARAAPATLRRIACPALLITADPARGAIVTPEAAAALQALAPQARVAHIAGAGHSIRREQFARYMAAVRAFLAETRG